MVKEWIGDLLSVPAGRLDARVSDVTSPFRHPARGAGRDRAGGAPAADYPPPPRVAPSTAAWALAKNADGERVPAVIRVKSSMAG